MTKEKLAPTESVLREDFESEMRSIWENFSLGSISLWERDNLVREILDPLEQNSPSFYNQLITKNKNGVTPLARIRDEGIKEAIRKISPGIRSVWKNFGLSLIGLKTRNEVLESLFDFLEQENPFLYSHLIEEDKNGVTPLGRIRDEGMKQARMQEYSRKAKSRKPKQTRTRATRRY